MASKLVMYHIFLKLYNKKYFIGRFLILNNYQNDNNNNSSNSNNNNNNN